MHDTLRRFDASYWHGRRVLVTGGASFIGSHLTDALVALGAEVSVADNLSSGFIANIAHHLKTGAITFHEVDLRDAALATQALDGIDTVFHLAAAHGGRGYVDLHQSACAENLYLDGLIFRTALAQGVRKVVYASSGCVYPLHLQRDPDSTLLLREDLAGPPYDADGMYGHAKLMGELTLRALHQENGLAAASCRYFTVYGPRGVENHAVIAMIARTFMRQDPFQVWGTGEQVRNWTYVDDIVSGTILAAEKIEDGTAVNLGTMERVRVLDAVEMVCKLAGYSPEIELQTDMPVGPLNRIADNSLAKELLGWEPQTNFEDGLKKTQEWYFSTKNVDEVRAIFDHMLTGRGAPQSDPVLAGASTGEGDRAAGA
jgi:nucleoside-diphosphate-sugar epimerase